MKKIIMIVLDGFGMRQEKHGNAVLNSNIRNFINLWENYPHCLLKASEEAVGLSKGQMGNSEVGHTTIGAGRLIKQPEMENFDFVKNDIESSPEFNELVEYVLDNNKTLHLMGLTSPGGIHSHLNIIMAILSKLHKKGVKNICYHAITDGRDTAVDSSYEYLKEVNDYLVSNRMGSVVSICGRYYAMDRDKKWDRTQKYYNMVTQGAGVLMPDIKTGIDACYQRNVTDEFIPPLILDRTKYIKDGDALMWLNFRPDRAKQILRCLTDPTFSEFPTVKLPNLKVLTMYKIDEAINSKFLITKKEVTNPLGVYLSKLGLSQARIAETEKYAHVTYFFDGGVELKLDKCDRFLIPSPKVATYDLKPEMSAVEVTKQAVKCMEEDYDFIFMNYANPDMVGHTGNYEATIGALEAVDLCLGRLIEVANNNFYKMVILADHGNADYMLDENDKPVTTHSLSLVPFIITDKKIKLENGSLTNVAKTVLDYMDIMAPSEMQNTDSLIVKED